MRMRMIALATEEARRRLLSWHSYNGVHLNSINLMCWPISPRRPHPALPSRLTGQVPPIERETLAFHPTEAGFAHGSAREAAHRAVAHTFTFRPAARGSHDESEDMSFE